MDHIADKNRRANAIKGSVGLIFLFGEPKFTCGVSKTMQRCSNFRHRAVTCDYYDCAWLGF